MQFEIFIEPEAIEDIQLAIAWYEEQSFGLGIRFHNIIEEHLKRISVNPFFQIRYDDVRCLPLLKFPFMIHFTVDEEKYTVIVRAVFNTSMDPKKWLKNK